MESFHNFVEINMVPLTFAYGLAYFAAGLAIALQQRQLSNFRLAHNLWLLGAFGIIHGVAEWGDIFIPIQSSNVSDWWISLLMNLQEIAWAVSYAFLLQFSITMITPMLPLAPRVRTLLRFYAPLWSLGVTITGVFFLPEELGRSWIRYMLGFPAAMLTAAAFMNERRNFATMRSSSIRANLTLTAAAFGIYAILGGLIVPEQALPGLGWLSYDNFHSLTNMPIQFWRMLTGVVIAVFVIRTLAIFDIEVRQRIETVEHEKALLNDRQRIARDLHDGVVQSIYAAGLQLEVAAGKITSSSADATTITRNVIGQLNCVIGDIRKYIFKLGPARTGEVDFDKYMRRLVDEFTSGGDLSVKISTQGRHIELSPEQKQNLAFIARECLSNVVRHARASMAEIKLVYLDDALLFSVEDNGIGIGGETSSKADQNGGRGLKDVTERAEAIGAQLSLANNARSGGALVLLKVPYEDTEAGDYRFD